MNLTERSEVDARAGEAGGLDRAHTGSVCSEPLFNARRRSRERTRHAFNQASRMADLSSAMRKVPGVSHPRPGLLSTGGVTTPT